MADNAATREYAINNAERQGSTKLAGVLRSAQKDGYTEWKKGWDAEHIDAPSDKDYNYQMAYEDGVTLQKKGDGGLQFLPEKYWINRRGGNVYHTDPASSVMPAGSSYDIESDSWQHQNSLARMGRKALSNAYQTVVSAAGGPFADAAADLGAYGGDREKAREDMLQAMTPDALELAQINESETWGGAGEMIGTVLTEFGLYFAPGGAAGMRQKVSNTVGQAGKVALEKNGFAMGKMQNFMSNFAQRVEMMVAPDSLTAEILYANSPEHSKEVTSAERLGNLLKENGVEGPFVEFLTSAKDDKMARIMSNIAEGMLFFEAARTAGLVGKKGGTAVWNKAREIAVTKYDEAVRELDVLQRAMQTSMNLGLPADAAAVRLRKQQNRKPGIGDQRNPRTVLSAEGKPDVVVGPQTKEDWKTRVQTNLTPDEVTKARTWYKDIQNAFRPHFGEQTDQFISAWLIANKNESPSGALHNALRVAEQIKTGIAGKKGGLNDEALRKLFQGMDIDKGLGQKLVDFIDSATGRETRQWMGDNPLGGAPAVVDVHTARDMGYVDEEMMNYLKNNGYDTSALELDMKGGPSETQYEVGAAQLRTLTDELNAEGYLGGDLTSSEVQAIGWTAQSKVTGASGQSPEQAIAGNLRRVSYELAPGEGSPAGLKYGERFAALQPEDQFNVTKQTLKGVTDVVNDLVGVQVSDVVYGLGGWQKYTNPAVVNQMLASKEGAEVTANAIGYLAQQQQVWVNKIKPMTKNPKGFGISITSDQFSDQKAVNQLWEEMMNGSDLVQGYQPITVEGKPGIMILVDKGGKKTLNAIDVDLRKLTDDLTKKYQKKGDIIVHIDEAEITKAGNAEKYDGQTYLERIRGLGREDIIESLVNHRGKLEEEFKANLEKAESKANQKGEVTSAPSNQEAPQ